MANNIDKEKQLKDLATNYKFLKTQLTKCRKVIKDEGLVCVSPANGTVRHPITQTYTQFLKQYIEVGKRLETLGYDKVDNDLDAFTQLLNR